MAQLKSQVESRVPGIFPLLGLWEESFGLWLDWTIRTRKSRVLPKRAQGEDLERRERPLITRDIGEVAFTCDIVAVVLGMCLHEGLVSA